MEEKEKLLNPKIRNKKFELLLAIFSLISISIMIITQVVPNAFTITRTCGEENLIFSSLSSTSIGKTPIAFSLTIFEIAFALLMIFVFFFRKFVLNIISSVFSLALIVLFIITDFRYSDFYTHPFVKELYIAICIIVFACNIAFLKYCYSLNKNKKEVVKDED